jgi:hypothetical protein
LTDFPLAAGDGVNRDQFGFFFADHGFLLELTYNKPLNHRKRQPSLRRFRIDNRNPSLAIFNFPLSIFNSCVRCPQVPD